MTTRELTIIADVLPDGTLLADETLLDTDSLLDLKLIIANGSLSSTPPPQPCPRGRASGAVKPALEEKRLLR